jgi:hypothetical protein
MFDALPMEGRATFLPFQDTLPGSVMNERQWALPGMLAGAWNAFTAPGRAARGQLDPSNEDAMAEALNIAGFANVGGMPALLSAARPMPGMFGMNVYHGSPHRFDAFDAAHIGKGEGAQAYGHGLYFAEKEGIARYYADKLGGDRFQWHYRDKPVTDTAHLDEIHDALDFLAIFDSASFSTGKVDTGLQKARELTGLAHPGSELATRLDRIIPALEAMKSGELKDITRSNLYKVDLPDPMVGRMLDWDKPLAEQPAAVRAALKRIPEANYADDAWTGQQFYDWLATQHSEIPGLKILDNPVGASERLQKAGIPGVRYLDQGSRASGQGTHNYVVFPGEEQRLKILERK